MMRKASNFCFFFSFLGGFLFFAGCGCGEMFTKLQEDLQKWGLVVLRLVNTLVQITLNPKWD